MGMLKLSRREGESILIGDDVEVVIESIEGGRVRVSVIAPSQVAIVRSELVPREEAPSQDDARSKRRTPALI
jgi:carbon storage regulator